jgi:hypothetical protein
MKKLIFLLLFAGCSAPAAKMHGSQKVYLVVGYRPDKYIERIFVNRGNAERYIEEYKTSHEYKLEEEILKD